MVGQIGERGELEAAEAEILDDVGHGVYGDHLVMPQETVGVAGADDAEGPFQHGGAGAFGFGDFDVLDVDVIAAVGHFLRGGFGVVQLTPVFGIELGEIDGWRAHT